MATDTIFIQYSMFMIIFRKDLSGPVSKFPVFGSFINYYLNSFLSRQLNINS